MIARTLGLLAVSVMLSGCFESDVEIWPIKSGEKVSSLPEGEYTCLGYDNGKPKTLTQTITSVTDGADLYYNIDEVDAPPSSGSFHTILPDLYVFATGQSEDVEFKFLYVRISEGHAVFIQPTREQAAEYAEKHSIQVGEAGRLDGGEPIPQLRNFIIDLGKNLDGSTLVTDCSPN